MHHASQFLNEFHTNVPVLSSLKCQNVKCFSSISREYRNETLALNRLIFIHCNIKFWKEILKTMQIPFWTFSNLYLIKFLESYSHLFNLWYDSAMKITVHRSLPGKFSMKCIFLMSEVQNYVYSPMLSPVFCQCSHLFHYNKKSSWKIRKIHKKTPLPESLSY